MRYIFIILILLIDIDAFSQKIKQHGFSINYNYQIPVGDLSERFGTSSSVGILYFFQQENNIFYSLEYEYIFGKNIKEDNILSNIETSSNSIISSDGYYANINLMQRGFASHLLMGYAIHFNDNNLSGIYLSSGLGYLQHKIFVETKNQDIPQLNENYKIGYDKQRSGVSAKIITEYKYYSKKGRLQFTSGISYILASTKNDRMYFFNDREFSSDKKYKDNILSFHFGMIVPINRSNKEKFHYY